MSISRQAATDALREFRAASHIIAKIHANYGERWVTTFADSPTADTGFTDAELERYRLAREHLIKSIELNPFFPDAHWMLANAHSEIDDDTDLLLKYYNSCLDLDPWHDDVIVARMGVLMENGDLLGAERDLEMLERLESSHAGPMRTHFDKLPDA